MRFVRPQVSAILISRRVGVAVPPPDQTVTALMFVQEMTWHLSEHPIRVQAVPSLAKTGLLKGRGLRAPARASRSSVPTSASIFQPLHEY